VTHYVTVSGKSHGQCLDKLKPFYAEEIVIVRCEHVRTQHMVTIETEDRQLADRIRREVRR